MLLFVSFLAIVRNMIKFDISIYMSNPLNPI